jgi:ATP-dependent Clp endopeptidase proteolytic subunit ClpP
MREGHIYIDGIITDNYHLQVRKQLENLNDAEKIVVHIQSPGGSVYAGYNTYHVLKSSGKPIEAIIEGECQSIATFISLAADKVTARNPSVYMIHNPYTMLEGDAKTMEQGANELRKIEDVMINAYRSKTKMSEDEIRNMMARETSMTAHEAKEYGFVDEVVDPLKMVAFGKQIKMNDKLEAFGQKMNDVLKELFGPLNMDVPLKDGTVVKVEVEEGEDIVGKMATVNGQPAPAGEHELASGMIIVVDENGMITEKKEPVSPAQLMEDENKKLKEELEMLKTEKMKADQTISEVQAKNTKTMEMMAGLQREFVELKKMTVGNPNPPVSAPVAQVKPVSEEVKVDALTESFINEYLPHFKRK